MISFAIVRAVGKQLYPAGCKFLETELHGSTFRLSIGGNHRRLNPRHLSGTTHTGNVEAGEVTERLVPTTVATSRAGVRPSLAGCAFSWP